RCVRLRGEAARGAARVRAPAARGRRCEVRPDHARQHGRVKAVQLVRWQAEPELREVAVPEPGPNEVLVKVDAAGLCHSDLHVIDWPEGTLAWELPFTLGHETAGTVAAVGRGVSAFEPGDAVLVYGPWGCGTCAQCARGAENLCTHRRAGGCGLG